MVPALLFLKSNWKLAIVGLMAFVIFYQNFSTSAILFGWDTIPSLHAKLEKKENEIKTAEENLKIAKDGNDKLAAALTEQNDQIAAIGALAQQFNEQFGKLANKLDKMRQETNQTVEDILKAPPPETCEAAMEYLHRAAHEGFLWDKK